MIWSLTHTVVRQKRGQSLVVIPIEMFPLGTLCSVAPVWLGRAISTVELTDGASYGTFVVEWWTPMCSKKEPKSVVAKEYWTRRWTPEVTHPQRINVTTVLYSHRMPSHKDKGPPKTYLIPEASAAMALANLASSGAIAEDEVGTDYEE